MVLSILPPHGGRSERDELTLEKLYRNDCNEDLKGNLRGGKLQRILIIRSTTFETAGQMVGRLIGEACSSTSDEVCNSV